MDDIDGRPQAEYQSWGLAERAAGGGGGGFGGLAGGGFDGLGGSMSNPFNSFDHVVGAHGGRGDVCTTAAWTK